MRYAHLGLVALVGLILCGAPAAGATTYALDSEHTSVGFKIRHLFSNVKGTFNDFEGEFEYVPGQPEQWTATATIQATSIDTNQENRDKHLRSKDFFDVETHPTLSFTSTKAVYADSDTTQLHGLLTIHGVEQPVVFDLEIHGEGSDPWGNLRSGFTATTTVNRKDFGLNWNQALETGQLLVGEEVEITLEVEGIAK